MISFSLFFFPWCLVSTNTPFYPPHLCLLSHSDEYKIALINRVLRVLMGSRVLRYAFAPAPVAKTIPTAVLFSPRQRECERASKGGRGIETSTRCKRHLPEKVLLHLRSAARRCERHGTKSLVVMLTQTRNNGTALPVRLAAVGQAEALASAVSSRWFVLLISST